MERLMAPDDRNFEKALSRHLRSEWTLKETSCADAETLAAYHERLLAPSELATWKEHIAACARCREILGQLEASERIALDLREQGAESEVLVRPGKELPSESAPLQPVEITSARPRRRRIAQWRYAVPAGAIAAGLLVWIVSRDGRLEQKILEQASRPESERSYTPADRKTEANEAVK